MALDTTAFDAALQQHYMAANRVRNLVERANVMIGMLRKNEAVGGNGMKTPVIHRNTTGGSSTFTNAQTNANSGGYEAFLQTHQDHFHVADIGDKVLQLSSHKEAFFSAKREIDLSIAQATNAIARKLYGDTGGSFARMANSSFATTALQLVNNEDAYHFEKNEVLVLSANKDGSGVKSGTLTVSSVNRITGVITLTGNISAGVATAAQNDYIFKQGDAAKGWTGLESFNPIDSSDLTTLHTVPQTDDPTRLGGYRLDATGMNIEEALIELAALLSFEGATPDVCFINPIRFKDLNLSVNSGRMGRREVKSRSGFVGYQAITLMGPKGEIKILQDTNCPPYVARMGELDTLCLKSGGMVPHIVRRDGLMMLRKSSSMDYEVRIAAYGDLTNEAPAFWGNAKLAATSA